MSNFASFTMYRILTEMDFLFFGPGVISCLRASYSNGVSGIRAVYLCHETDHFASGVGDAGWGCGYRNTQMIISALLRSNVYHKLVTDGKFAKLFLLVMFMLTMFCPKLHLCPKGNALQKIRNIRENVCEDIEETVSDKQC